MHGIGKTTLINKICTNAPLIKIVDEDLVPSGGIGEAQQMRRMTIMNTLLETMPTHTDIIMDRSPVDFSIYNRLVCPDSKMVLDVMNRMLHKYYDIGIITTLHVYDSWENIWNRIQKRSRDKYSEKDEFFSKKVFEEYERYNDKIYTITRIHIDSAEDYILKLLS
jgi:deoxyadenosine/deoxycytidine kinase